MSEKWQPIVFRHLHEVLCGAAYMCGVCIMCSCAADYSLYDEVHRQRLSSLTELMIAELLIATLGRFTTLTWSGMSVLIQKFFLKNYRIINILFC